MSTVMMVRNLSFGYNGHPILNNINFNLLAGKLLIICGSSGQGKTTLLRLLMGLETIDKGSIRIFNKDINSLETGEYNKLKSRIGSVFQNSALISTLSVENNLKLPLIYHNLADTKEIEKRVDSTLDMLLIKEYRKNFPAELSLGLQKRTAMARAIITQPELIFMDEPTSGLDSINRSVFMALVDNIRLVHNVAMIMVTNDLTIARKMDSEIGVLKDGEMLEPMAYDQLMNSPDSFVHDLLKEMRD
jgi:phospholipid/cholesterol/gamma-HCH transport system ATP-binding protein